MFYHVGFREQNLDVEVAVPVDAATRTDLPLHNGGRLTVHELPGVDSVASMVYQGPYETLAEAYSAIGTWIDANSYQISGPGREHYLRGPGEGEPITEIQFPVAPVVRAGRRREALKRSADGRKGAICA